MVLSCLPFMGIGGRNLSSHVLSILGFKHRKTQFEKPAWTMPAYSSAVGPDAWPRCVLRLMEHTPGRDNGCSSRRKRGSTSASVRCPKKPSCKEDTKGCEVRREAGRGGGSGGG